ncbi:MAG: hypothetical protein HC929_14520 [Leptolyngbyaceae cyanobacterium SM2_5_2]|nr:hypothetical protein [Leptolyngbyaceae cyanobacterium SM2_5_2]
MILARLMALATLQQRGYLDGDDWYLHNQFGQSQQRGPDQFWAQVFQPLCQGLALPPDERPLILQSRLRQIPFLPTGPFSPHPLDQRWGQVALPDAAFEPALTWLGDLLAAPNPMATQLPALLEMVVNSHSGLALTTPEPMLMALVDRTLNAALLDQAETLTEQRHDSIEQLLMVVTPNQAKTLLTALGEITLLDPACGSGRVLLVACTRPWS